ncbi:MAG: 7-cyano-7-deazaguanine synthase QueC [Acidobacteriota bacterium]
MRRAVCLVSGGMDSCVSAAVARSEGFETALLHFSYGQRTQHRELQAFRELADFWNVQLRMEIELPHFSRIGGSALTDSRIELPEGALDRPGIPVSYVPFRNANLLAAATSWAEVLEASRVYIGAVEEDSSGYPDCRETFFQAFNRVVREGTRPETSIEIVTPLIHMTKKDIVLKGVELRAPLHLTWSCYQGEEVACGRCDSCLLRLRGFAAAGIEDPVPYAGQTQA